MLLSKSTMIIISIMPVLDVLLPIYLLYVFRHTTQYLDWMGHARH